MNRNAIILSILLMWAGSVSQARDEVRVAVMVSGLPQLYQEFHGRDDDSKNPLKMGIYSFEKQAQVQLSGYNRYNSENFFKKYGVVDKWLSLHSSRKLGVEEKEQINNDYHKLISDIEQEAQRGANSSVSSPEPADSKHFAELKKLYANFIYSFQPATALVYAHLFRKLNDVKKETVRYSYYPVVWPSRLLGFLPSKDDVKEDYEFYKGGKEGLTKKQQLFLGSLDGWIKTNDIKVVDFNISLDTHCIYNALKEHHSLLSFTKEKLKDLAGSYFRSNQILFEELAKANPKVIFVHNAGFTLPKGVPLLEQGWERTKRDNVVSTLMLETAKIEDQCGVFVRRSSNFEAEIALPGFYRYSFTLPNGMTTPIDLKSPGIANALFVYQLLPTLAKKDNLEASDLLEYFYKHNSKSYFALRGKVEKERGILNASNITVATINPRFPEAFIEKLKNKSDSSR